MTRIALICLLLTGCHLQQPGSTVYERTVATGGAITERVSYTSPSDAKDASSVSITIPWGNGPDWREVHIASTFSGGHTPEPASRREGQRILYIAAAVCGLMGLGLIGFKHFKLGLVSWGGAGGFVMLAVNADRFPVLYMYALGGILILVLSFLGWMLWLDYKDDGGINGSPYLRK